MGTVASDLRHTCNFSPCCCPEDDEKPHVTILEKDDGPEPLDSESFIDFTEDITTPTSSVFNLEIRPALEVELKKAEQEQTGIKKLRKTIKLPHNYKFHDCRYGLIRYSPSTDHWYAAPDRMDRLRMQNTMKKEEEKGKRKAEKEARGAEGGSKKPWQKLKKS